MNYPNQGLYKRNIIRYTLNLLRAGVVKLVYTIDSKSIGGNSVRVQVPSPAVFLPQLIFFIFNFNHLVHPNIR